MLCIYIFIYLYVKYTCIYYIYTIIYTVHVSGMFMGKSSINIEMWIFHDIPLESLRTGGPACVPG